MTAISYKFVSFVHSERILKTDAVKFATVLKAFGDSQRITCFIFIAKLIEGMSTNSQFLATKAEELAKTSTEISNSITEVKMITQKSIQNSEQIGNESSSISDVSRRLENLVSKFQVN